MYISLASVHPIQVEGRARQGASASHNSIRIQQARLPRTVQEASGAHRCLFQAQSSGGIDCSNL